MGTSLSLIEKLKKYDRFTMTLFLTGMSLFCFSLSVFRIIISDRLTFFFLIWNLFLAFIPWLISSLLVIYKKTKPFYIILLMGVWLLFFPNSPYILTDLFHLQARIGVPIWFDLIVILSFAWTGLMFGFISLMDIESILKTSISAKIVTVISVSCLFLASFGVYLGRYLRWNSWDIVSNPFGLFNDIIDRFANPFDYPRTWGMTLFMGILLNMMYFSMNLFKNMNAPKRK